MYGSIPNSSKSQLFRIYSAPFSRSLRSHMKGCGQMWTVEAAELGLGWCPCSASGTWWELQHIPFVHKHKSWWRDFSYVLITVSGTEQRSHTSQCVWREVTLVFLMAFLSWRGNICRKISGWHCQMTLMASQPLPWPEIWKYLFTSTYFCQGLSVVLLLLILSRQFTDCHLTNCS